VKKIKILGIVSEYLRVNLVEILRITRLRSDLCNFYKKKYIYTIKKILVVPKYSVKL